MSTADDARPSAAPSTGTSPPPSAPSWSGPAPPATDYTRRQVDRAAGRRPRCAPRCRCARSPGSTKAARSPRPASSTVPNGSGAATESMRVMTGGERGRRQAAAHHRPHHRRADGCGAGLHLVGHPRPVRPVRRQRRRAASGVPQRDRRRAAAAGVACRLPALGVPARGHPSGAVPRQPVAGRAHVRRARRC